MACGPSKTSPRPSPQYDVPTVMPHASAFLPSLHLNTAISQGLFENQVWPEVGNPDHNVICSMPFTLYFLKRNPFNFVSKCFLIKEKAGSWSELRF